MTEYLPKNLDPLLSLFNVCSKREAELHCRGLVIHSEDLAAIFIASRVGGLGPYKYANRFSESSPAHLRPKQSELEAPIEVGPLQGEAAKLFRKLFQTLEERRVFAAHLFYTPDHEFWHIFSFDQRDISDGKNQWEHGPHIHYANDTFHPAPLNQIWVRVCKGESAFLKPLHIRYQGRS